MLTTGQVRRPWTHSPLLVCAGPQNGSLRARDLGSSSRAASRAPAPVRVARSACGGRTDPADPGELSASCRADTPPLPEVPDNGPDLGRRSIARWGLWRDLANGPEVGALRRKLGPSRAPRQCQSAHLTAVPAASTAAAARRSSPSRPSSTGRPSQLPAGRLQDPGVETPVGGREVHPRAGQGVPDRVATGLTLNAIFQARRLAAGYARYLRWHALDSTRILDSDPRCRGSLCSSCDRRGEVAVSPWGKPPQDESEDATTAVPPRALWRCPRVRKGALA